MADGIADILEKVAAEVDGTEPSRHADASHESQPRVEEDAEQAAADLRRQLDESRRAQAEAIRQRDAEAEERRRLQSTTEVAQITTLSTALESAQQRAETLKTQLQAAGESGDFRTMAEINLQLGRLGSEMERLEAGKSAFETRRTETLRTPVPARDPIEADIAQRTPRTAEWLRRNRDFYTDAAFRNRVVGADSLAKGRGIQPDTDEYFRFVEEHAGVSNSSPPPSRTAPSFAAPPSRQAPSMSGRQQGGDVHISADDRKIAEWMGVDPVEYVKERESLRSRGEWPHRRR